MLRSQKRHFVSIQILRGVSVIPVYLFHQTFAGEKFYSWCVWGITVFFLISGFLNGMSPEYDDRPGVMYCIRTGARKVRRLFPLHVVMLILAFVMWVVSNISELSLDPPAFIPTALVKFVLNLLLISDWVPHLPALAAVNGEYNIVTWFLSACLLFYILTPAIRKAMHRLYDNRSARRPYIAMLCILAYSVVWYLLFRRIQSYDYAYWYIYECPLARIADYVMGMHLGYVFNAMPGEKKAEHKSVLRIMLAVSLVLSVILVLYATFVLNGKYDLIVSAGFYYMIPVAAMVFSMVSLESASAEASDGHIGGPVSLLLWLGAISPYAYLIQVPMINGVHGIYKRIADVRMSVWCIISVCLTLVLSEVYRRWSERKRKASADA